MGIMIVLTVSVLGMKLLAGPTVEKGDVAVSDQGMTTTFFCRYVSFISVLFLSLPSYVPKVIQGICTNTGTKGRQFHGVEIMQAVGLGWVSIR